MGGLGGEEDLGGLVGWGLGELDDVEVSAAVAAASEGAVEAHVSFSSSSSGSLSLAFSLFLFQSKKKIQNTDCGMAEQRIVTGFGCGSSGPLTPARIYCVPRNTKQET